MRTDASTSIPGETPERQGQADGHVDEVLGAIRELLAIGRLTTARRLVERELGRFPDHAELGKLRRLLDLRKAKPSPLVEPSTSDEIEWLNDPPESARGHWVALIGREVVAMADSFRELKEALRSRDLAQEPLIHRVAP